MSILEEAELLLIENEYDVWQRPEESDQLYFEDASVFGMLTTYESPEELVRSWEDRQARFLRLHRDDLRSSGNKEKVWNAYTVHLTVAEVNDETVVDINDDMGQAANTKEINVRNELYRIEEDFVGTRKIVRVGVGEDDVREALLPLLEIQADPEIAPRTYREELRKTLKAKYEDPFLLLLNEGTPVEDIADELIADQ